MKFLVCLSAILLVITLGEAAIAHNETSHGCSPGFTNLNNRCYYFGTVQSSWYKAFQSCITMGANLASLDNLEENAIVKAHVRELDLGGKGHNWWLGATDDSQEGVFTWINSLNHVIHTDWSVTDPNNYIDESCVYLFADRDYQWEDRSCDFKSHFICEENN